MEWLTAAWTRSANRVRSLSPTARVIAGVILAIGAIGLVCLKTDPLGQRYEYLLGGRDFSDEEIDSMQAAFAQAGLNEWQVDGHRIRLPRAERHAYLAALAENRAMPETFGSASERLLESHNLFESSKVRQFRQRHAMQKELSLIVSRMAGIDMATVKYDEVELGGFPVRIRKTAMVAARAGGSQALSDQQVGSIRDLVAGAIAGLEIEDVTVTDLGSGRTYRGNMLPDEQPGQSLIAARRDLEESLRQRITGMLSIYPGVVVAVNAELTATHSSGTDASHTAAKVAAFADPRGPAPLTADDSGNRPRVPRPTPAEQFPGSVVHLPSDGDLLDGRLEIAEPNASEPPSDSRQAAPRVRQVTASVAVPRSYFLQVWRKRQQWAGQSGQRGPTPETLSRVESEVHATIERQVLAMLPAPAGQSMTSPRVVVSTYDDIDPVSVPSAERDIAWSFLEQEGVARNALLLAMAVVGVLALVLLQRRWQRQRAPHRSEADPAVDDWPDEPASLPESHPLTDAPQTLQDELAALVRRDPDAAAGILRDWVGEAA